MTCLCPHCPPRAPVVPVWEEEKEEARRFAAGVGSSGALLRVPRGQDATGLW